MQSAAQGICQDVLLKAASQGLPWKHGCTAGNFFLEERVTITPAAGALPAMQSSSGAHCQQAQYLLKG